MREYKFRYKMMVNESHYERVPYYVPLQVNLLIKVTH